MSVKRLTRISVLAGILYIAQVSLSVIPNVELVSPLILVFSLVFKKDALISIMIFVILEGLFWGFGLWWFSYLYVWPILYFMIVIISKYNVSNDFIVWAIVLGLYGFGFGFLFAIVYLPLSLNAMISYWIAGLSFDLIHGISNFLVTLIIVPRLYQVLILLKERYKF